MSGDLLPVSEIARRWGLSFNAVAVRIRHLEEQGWIRPAMVPFAWATRLGIMTRMVKAYQWDDVMYCYGLWIQVRDRQLRSRPKTSGRHEPPTEETIDRLMTVIAQVERGETWPAPQGRKQTTGRYGRKSWGWLLGKPRKVAS